MSTLSSPPSSLATATSPSPSAHSNALDILQTLPPPQFAFAYGSAVFPNKTPSSMIDLIIAVDNPQVWHTLNLSQNPHHYSLPMSLLGPQRITQTQRLCAKVYYNTILSPKPFKYGVIQTSDLCDDLLHWHSLYLSGRMHKPIAILLPPSSTLSSAMQVNLDAAAAAALLCLPERFKETELYTTVAGLSYTGDVRMKLPVEVKTKVSDIVRANIDRFRSLYSPLSSWDVAHARSDGIWCRDMNATGKNKLINRLPQNIRLSLCRKLGVRSELQHVESERLARAVTAVVGGVVARNSLRQSLKGVVTAGFTTSLRYVAAKMRKSLVQRYQSRFISS